MPIGIVDESDFEKELNRAERSPIPELKPAQIIDRGRGRNEGDVNVPQVIRDIIIDEKVENGRASALQFAKMVGVSDSSVSAYSHGTNSTAAYHTPDKRTNDKLKKAKYNLARKASKRLDLALENITEDKLADANIKDLALVAKAMSGVIKDMDPPTPNEGGQTFNGPSIIMYNPGFTKESSFDTVEAGE